MSQYPTMGGEAVRTETQLDRDAARLPAPPAPHQAEYITTQTLAPYLIGLLRGVYLGVFGAIGGLLTGLQMGSREWDQLLWGMVIGFCLGFLGRGAEAVIIDEPKSNSVTEKV